MLKKFIITLFFCTISHFEAQAWFFHYNNPVQETVLPAKETLDILATVVLIGNGEHKATNDFLTELKKILETKLHEINVVVTYTSAHESKNHVPAMSNKAGIDMALSIRIVDCQSRKPTLFIYRYSWGNEFISRTIDMAMYPLEDAYLFSKEATISWATSTSKQLIEIAQDLYSVKGPYACPFNPLVGIKKPALGFELCVANKDQLSLFIEPLVEAIGLLLNPLIKLRKRTTDL